MPRGRTSCKFGDTTLRETSSTHVKPREFVSRKLEQFPPGSLTTKTSRYVAPSLRYLGVKGSVDRFERVMRAQLDLRTEAANLERLHALFGEDDSIVVPRPRALCGSAGATRDVLVEYFCEGMHPVWFTRPRFGRSPTDGARNMLSRP